MSNKIRSIITIVLFAALLVVPMINTNFESGRISETENRALAPLPEIFEADGSFSDTFRADAESWINDNIGMRSEYMQMYTDIKLSMNMSTSDKVLFGRDGWYYYTGDSNIEIATGEYELTEEMLAEIAYYQQMTSDHYKSIGVDYVLALTPSKVSVYPEYLPMNDYTVDRTAIDILTDYLQEHTDVKVYNGKPAVVAAKAEGQVFCKTDSHWTMRGSYAFYEGLYGFMKENGFVDGEPLEVTFGEGPRTGEFSKMLGVVDILGKENVPVAQWEKTFSYIPDSPYMRELEALNPSDTYKMYMYHNDNSEQRVLIYADSQWEDPNGTGQYFAEDFNQVLRTRIRSIVTELDDKFRPDIVVFGCSERYINTVLLNAPYIPMVCNDTSFMELPAHATPTKHYHGMVTDLHNGVKPAVSGTFDISADDGYVNLYGWAADFDAMKPLSAMYLKVGDTYFTCTYGLEREGVGRYYENDDFINTGYKVSFSPEYLNDGEITEISFIMVSNDGTYRYEPVVYNINYK